VVFPHLPSMNAIEVFVLHLIVLILLALHGAGLILKAWRSMDPGEGIGTPVNPSQRDGHSSEKKRTYRKQKLS
jgi:hypothetical protein